MRRYHYIVVLGILLMTIGIISYSRQDIAYEYANHPAEITGTYVIIEGQQSRDKYYILVDSNNHQRVMKMYLNDVMIQNTDSETLTLSDIETGDTIRVNFMGDIVASYPEIITQIQSVTLIKKNYTDVEALIKLIPEH